MVSADKKIFNYKKRAQNLAEDVRKDIDNINKRKDITGEDKKNFAEHARSQAIKRLGELKREMQNEAENFEQDAAKKYKKAQQADKKEMHQKAQTLMPLLATMSEDEIINLYKNTHSDKATRQLISEALEARIFSTPNPETSKLYHSFVKAEKQMEGNLPQDEKEALDNLRYTKEISNYANNAEKLINIKIEGLKRENAGGKLDPVHSVSLTMITHELDMMERGEKMPEMPETEEISTVKESNGRAKVPNIEYNPYLESDHAVSEQ